MKFTLGGPPYRIETDRLVLRCWNPGDAEKLAIAISESRKSLLPWMPWANNEPLTLQERVGLLRTFRSAFDRDEDYVYGIFDKTEERVIGGCGLHKTIGPLGFEIGYWIRNSAARKGFATETSGALIKAGFELFDIDRIEIHCDERNAKSKGVAEKLGLRFECALPRRQMDANGNYRTTMQWAIFRSEYEESEFTGTNVVYYSAMNEQLTPVSYTHLRAHET